MDGKEGCLSERTILHHHRLISAMLNAAMHWQLINANPATRIKPPKSIGSEAKHYEIEEVNKLLKLIESEPLK